MAASVSLSERTGRVGSVGEVVGREMKTLSGRTGQDGGPSAMVAVRAAVSMVTTVKRPAEQVPVLTTVPSDR